MSPIVVTSFRDNNGRLFHLLRLGRKSAQARCTISATQYTDATADTDANNESMSVGGSP